MGPPWCPPRTSSTGCGLCRTHHHYVKSVKESITSTLGGGSCGLLLSAPQADVTGKNQTSFCRTWLNFFDTSFFCYLGVWLPSHSQILWFHFWLSFQGLGILGRGQHLFHSPWQPPCSPRRDYPSYLLCSFGAQKVLQQGVASEENIGFCPVTPTILSETPGIW